MTYRLNNVRRDFDARLRDRAVNDNLDAEIAAANAHLAKTKRADRIICGFVWLLTATLPGLVLAEDSTPGGVAVAIMFVAMMAMSSLALTAICRQSHRSYARQIATLRLRRR